MSTPEYKSPWSSVGLQSYPQATRRLNRCIEPYRLAAPAQAPADTTALACRRRTSLPRAAPSVEVPGTSSYRVLPASHQKYCHTSVKSLFCSTTTGSSFFSCDRLVPSFMLEAASCLRLLLCYAGLYCCTSEE